MVSMHYISDKIVMFDCNLNAKPEKSRPLYTFKMSITSSYMTVFMSFFKCLLMVLLTAYRIYWKFVINKLKTY